MQRTVSKGRVADGNSLEARICLCKHWRTNEKRGRILPSVLLLSAQTVYSRLSSFPQIVGQIISNRLFASCFVYVLKND